MMSVAGAVLAILLGCIVLAVSLLDILATTFHPTAQSKLTARFNRLIWHLLERCARHLPPNKRSALLSWTLPITVTSLLLFWIVSLLVGFGLLYAPDIASRAAFASSDRPLHWPDAFYLSGVCLTSIGFGDIVPREGLLRAVTVCEGIVGLLVIGVTITYALSVFPVLPSLRVLASTLNEETDGQANAVPMVQRYLAAESTETLAQRCRELSTQLRLLAEAHSMHPVLFYAHPKRPEQSFLRVLVVTQRLALLLRYGLKTSEHAKLVHDPRVIGLEESLIAVLRELGRSLHLRVREPEETYDDPALNAEFDTLVGVLLASKLREDGSPTRRERRHYVRFRLVTDPYIRAYWANAGYSEAEVWGPHAPLKGQTAPIYSDDGEDEEQ